MRWSVIFAESRQANLRDMMRHAYNLVIIRSKDREHNNDFGEIAERIRAKAPDIKVFVTGGRHRRPWIPLLVRSKPTLVVEMTPNLWFRPKRGKVVKIPLDRLPKSATLAPLEAAGLPVPKWTVITPETKLDPAEWGPYVVVKPEMGRNGAGVIIHKTGRVRYRPPESFEEGHYGRIAPMIAQRFIYTGRWPVSYRILTFLGEPIYGTRNEADHNMRPLEGPSDFRKGGGISVVSTHTGATITFTEDNEVIALARSAHRALPDWSILGTDIVRDKDTGRLFIIECNCTYRIWHLSSALGSRLRRAHGLNLYGQWGALDVAADALITATRARAG